MKEYTIMNFHYDLFDLYSENEVIPFILLDED